jgi:sister-chromatid-cohesion protein PDS5
MDRLQDTEEKVRMESVKAICETAIKDISAVSEELLLALMERMRDRKWPLRKYTINSLAVLYNAIVKRFVSLRE